MLTKLIIRNFKPFEDATIDLGNPVVFVGPNNSGKTSAMQALSLWSLGVKRWSEKRADKTAPKKRPGVTINRRDLLSIPVPNANLLWRGLKVRQATRAGGSQRTDNVNIEITVEGVNGAKAWKCGFEFYYANPESFYCRPLRQPEGSHVEAMLVPEAAALVEVAFLPPMSGLVATETRLDQGAVNVRVGEGRTAEVLRNICYQLCTDKPGSWKNIITSIEKLFGATLESPRYIEERGEIEMGYREGDILLDLSSSGRGLQQTLLILGFMAANPGATILLDEPDAHLEILRQRQIYRVINKLANQQRTQVIAASHSEILLNEAAEKDQVVAFVGKPHRIDGHSSQVLKALKTIGFEQYYQAKIAGWVLYLEGSTDLEILRALAERLEMTGAIQALEKPFVHYIGDNPKKAEEHFFGLREAFQGLQGVAIFDRLEKGLPDNRVLRHLEWRKREIENYLCTKRTLEVYAQHEGERASAGPLFEKGETDKHINAMHRAIDEISDAMQKLQQGTPWDHDTKVSDVFLTPLFRTYYAELGLPNLMAKKSFYELSKHIPLVEIDDEVREKLRAIEETSQSAQT